MVTSPIPRPETGDVLIRTCYISADPYVRNRMRETNSYAPMLELNDVVLAEGLGQVIESRDANFQRGEISSHPWVGKSTL